MTGNSGLISLRACVWGVRAAAVVICVCGPIEGV